MKNYNFPKDNWYIKVTDKNRHIINSWKIKQRWNNDLFSHLEYTIVLADGSGSTVERAEKDKSIVEITTNEFIKFVLGEEIEDEIGDEGENDYNYLIDLLNKIK